MNYKAICEQNKYLYGLLEGLTEQIIESIAKDGGIADNSIEDLENKKHHIMELIDKNLDRIEQIWYAQSLVYRPAKRTVALREPSLKELQIILSYKFDPNQSQDTLAEKYNMGIGTVQNTITKLLNKEFIGV